MHVIKTILLLLPRVYKACSFLRMTLGLFFGGVCFNVKEVPRSINSLKTNVIVGKFYIVRLCQILLRSTLTSDSLLLLDCLCYYTLFPIVIQAQYQ